MSTLDPLPCEASADEVEAGNAVIDVGRLHELRTLAAGDDDDVYVMLADLFLVELTQEVAALRDAAVRRDVAAVVEGAHRLRGAASNLGATALTALFLELEELGPSGQLIGRDAFARVDAEHQRYREAVAALRGGSATQ